MLVDDPRPPELNFYSNPLTTLLHSVTFNSKNRSFGDSGVILLGRMMVGEEVISCHYMKPVVPDSLSLSPSPFFPPEFPAIHLLRVTGPCPQLFS